MKARKIINNQEQ